MFVLCAELLSEMISELTTRECSFESQKKLFTCEFLIGFGCSVALCEVEYCYNTNVRIKQLQCKDQTFGISFRLNLI